MNWQGKTIKYDNISSGKSSTHCYLSWYRALRQTRIFENYICAISVIICYIIKWIYGNKPLTLQRNWDKIKNYKIWYENNSDRLSDDALHGNIQAATVNTEKTLTVNGVTKKIYTLCTWQCQSEPFRRILAPRGIGHDTDRSPFRTSVADANGCIVVYPQGANQYFAIFGGSIPGWNSGYGQWRPGLLQGYHRT